MPEEKKQKLKEYQKVIEKQKKKKKKKKLINLFYSSLPKYCNLSSPIHSSGTFKFSNMISVISNSFLTSLLTLILHHHP